MAHIVWLAANRALCGLARQDGTVNVHTIREGQYLRTLHPVGCVDPQAEVAFLTLSHLGHIAFTANDQVNSYLWSREDGGGGHSPLEIPGTSVRSSCIGQQLSPRVRRERCALGQQVRIRSGDWASHRWRERGGGGRRGGPHHQPTVRVSNPDSPMNFQSPRVLAWCRLP